MSRPSRHPPGIGTRERRASKLAGDLAELIDALLHSVADECQGVHLPPFTLVQRMGQHLLDLRLAGPAIDPAQEIGEGTPTLLG
ncbi:MAG TPA: hypothetical protein VGJ20_04250 [Xanthobacteraceae bacterium]